MDDPVPFADRMAGEDEDQGDQPSPGHEGGGPSGADDVDVGAQTDVAPAERSPSQHRLHHDVRAALFDRVGVAAHREAGTVLAGRYRIIAAIGRGGMGEVYRALDMVLGEEVALKFLPERYADNDALMQRFVGEARIARHITHPNVCRVHDIGEADGRKFLSMELIDGEDLSSLLRRIGRLPQEKAFELAQQLCAGLAALHESGVLHRDLKPSNVMIDGRGRVKLADFGLAAFADDLSRSDVRDGTPAYMAPEQAAGEGVSERSDIYALGLVLYEIVTGLHALRSGASSTRAAAGSTPQPISEHVRGLPHELDEVITACLDPDPAARPQSVLAVASALPGGDPVAAAIAAGRAPSVEAVARAGSSGAMRPLYAYAIALATAVLTLALAAGASTASVLGRSQPQLSPDVLKHRAEEILKVAAAPADYVDEYTKLSLDRRMTRRALPDGSANPHADLAADGPSPLLFYLRRSPEPFVPRGRRVSLADPARTEPGELQITLDGRGLLRKLSVVPPGLIPDAEGEPQWSALLEAAGFDPQAVQLTEPRLTPPVAADRHFAWTGIVTPGAVRAVVEASTYRGQLVEFIVVPPWDNRREPPSARNQTWMAGAQIVAWTALIGVVVVLGLLVRRSLVRREADVVGALQVSAVLAGLGAASGLMSGHPGWSIDSVGVWGRVIARSLFMGGIMFALYLVVEPQARRLVPGSMVAWTRLVRGRWRDRLVARSVLLGVLVGVVLAHNIKLTLLLTTGNYGWFEVPNLVHGGRRAVAALVLGVVESVMTPLQVFVLFIAVRLVMRGNRRAAVVSFVLVVAAQATGGSAWEIGVSLASGAIFAGLLLAVVLRMGFLSMVAMGIALQYCLTFPMTTDLDAWYSGSGLVGMFAIAGLTAFGLRCARPAPPVKDG